MQVIQIASRMPVYIYLNKIQKNTTLINSALIPLVKHREKVIDRFKRASDTTQEP